MTEFVFTPSECKGDNPKFSGSITLKVLSTPEKFRLMSKCEFEVGDDGVVKKNMKQLSAIADMIDATKPYFLKVDLKRLSDNKVYQNYSELEFADECATILIEASTQFLNALKVGNG